MNVFDWLIQIDTKGNIYMDNNMADNCVEVDFPYLDENNKHFGETFSINIDDLKIIK